MKLKQFFNSLLLGAVVYFGFGGNSGAGTEKRAVNGDRLNTASIEAFLKTDSDTGRVVYAKKVSEQTPDGGHCDYLVKLVHQEGGSKVIIASKAFFTKGAKFPAKEFMVRDGGYVVRFVRDDGDEIATINYGLPDGRADEGTFIKMHPPYYISERTEKELYGEEAQKEYWLITGKVMGK